MDWEYKAELERGVRLGSGERWSGHRIRYRERGTRRWSSFLLEVSPEQLPTDAQILQAIEAHAARHD